MYFSKLRLQNFRGIEDLSLEFQPGCNVLAGVNGIGKSAILDAICLMMERLIAGFDKSTTPSFIASEDIKSDFQSCKLEMSVVDGAVSKSWHLNATRTSPNTNGGEGSLPIWPAILNPANFRDSRLPILTLYTAHRAFRRLAEPAIPSNEVMDRIREAYQFGEEGATDFSQFLNWFKVQEDVENERRVEEPLYRAPAMEAVREAVHRFTGFEKLRIRRQTPMRMTLEKLGVELSVNQLSDGEKTMLAMVGDIARRLSLLNPLSKFEDILAGTGVVLIDEIELHLHPKWQREILTKLQGTFPNCQFIVTTHSPQVLSHVEADRIWLLDRDADGKICAQHPDLSLGLDSNRILLELFDVPERPQEAKDDIAEVFRLVGTGELVEAREQIGKTKAKVGNIPELDAASALIRRKEQLGR